MRVDFCKISTRYSCAYDVYIEPPPCSITCAVSDQRRLELLVLYARLGLVDPTVTTLRQPTPSCSFSNRCRHYSARAGAACPYSSVVWKHCFELFITFAEKQRPNTCPSVLIGVYCVYLFAVNQTHCVLPVPLRIRSYSRDFDSACWH